MPIPTTYPLSRLEVLHRLPASLRAAAAGIHLGLQANGFGALFYCGYRSPQEQARLYRRTRTLQEIEAHAKDLHARGFDVLAEILLSVGPQTGPIGKHVTRAGPGESWHQYRLALDGVPLVDGVPAWDYPPLPGSAEEAAWMLYGELARQANVYWGGDWPQPDAPHLQTQKTGSPLTAYSPSMIENLAHVLDWI